MYIKNKNKNILVLSKEPTHVLDNATLTTDDKYPINFKQSGKRFVLNLHYIGSNSFLFANATKIYQFKAKDPEIKPSLLRLGNISKDFTIDDMKKAGLKRNVKLACVDYNAIDISSMSDI